MDRIDQLLERLLRIESQLNESSSPWMTVVQAGCYLKLSERSVRRYLSTGRLKSYTLPGGGVRLLRRDLDSFALFKKAYEKLSRQQRQRVHALQARDQ